jgi:hypothetical protein
VNPFLAGRVNKLRDAGKVRGRGSHTHGGAGTVRILESSVKKLDSGPEFHFFLISLVCTIKEETTPGGDFLGS